MTKLYKLTDKKGYTRALHPNACLWGPGVSHSGTGEGGLCGPGWIHAYVDPLLALVMNPVHANLETPRMWAAEGIVKLKDHGVKVGCLTLTTIEELKYPRLTLQHRMHIASKMAELAIDAVAYRVMLRVKADYGEFLRLRGSSSAGRRLDLKYSISEDTAHIVQRAARRGVDLQREFKTLREGSKSWSTFAA